MKKYELKLKECFIKADKREIESLPIDDRISHSFSDDFNEKMNKLITQKTRKSFSVFSSPLKRVAVLLLVSVIAVGSTLSVKGIREPVFDFLFKIYKDHTGIYASNKEKDSIECQYTLSYIPDGFEEREAVKSNVYSSFVWTNEYGKTIYFSQSVQSSSLSISSNDEAPIQKSINGINILTSENSKGYSIGVWNENGYIFYISYPTELGEKFLYKIIGNLKEA